MHIKQIIIEGFKTYKNYTAIPQFDPRHNIIVGKNGSGKSNVFAAIQFVLGDKYSSIRAEERQQLLHEGAGRDVISASVEIIFDNTDSRFPMEKKEVSIKRTIGLKKDEFFVNHSHASKSEVHGLLETAGLTKENQYNIVQQGKVDRLIQMTEAQRLELLKEIAGTKTYDERRRESMKIMTETDSRRTQIEEVITHIESRLNDLEGEKEELQKYQQLDTVRRSLEYAIYDKELKAANDQLEDLERSREESHEKSQELHDKAAKLKELRVKAEEEAGQLDLQNRDLKSKLEVLKRDQQEYGKRKADREMKIREHKEKIQADEQKRRHAGRELGKLTKNIEASRKNLEKINKSFEQHVADEEKVKYELQMQEQRLHSLLAKKGRKQQFSSKKQRDRFLGNKLKECKAEIQVNERTISASEKLTSNLKKSIASIKKELQKREKDAGSKRNEIQDIRDSIEKLKKKRDEVSSKRVERFKERAEKKKEQKEWEDAYIRSENDLKHSMDRSMYAALSEVKRFAQEKKLKGYYGPLIELFTCDKVFRKCVETTAGNKLFHIVVDNDVTASKIIAHLRKRKAGRLTFMPLNRLKSSEPNYPEGNTEAVPMAEKLQYDAKFRKAIVNVFGKTLITRTLEIGTKFARSHKLDTITLDGDQVNRRGALTGGFIEHKTSRLDAFERKVAAERKLKKTRQEYDNIEGRVEVENQKEAKLTGELNKKYAEKLHLRNILEGMQNDNKKLAKDRDIEESKQKNNEAELARLRAEKEQLVAQIRSIQSELRSDLVDELNSQDQTELDTLTSATTDLRSKLIDTSKLRAEAESKKKIIETELSTNLEKRAEELQQELNSQSQEEATEEFDKEKEELRQLNEAVSELNEQAKDAEATIDKITARHRKIQMELEKLKGQESDHDKQLQSEANNVDKFFTTRNNLARRVQDCRIKIRNIGALAREEYTKHGSSSIKTLMGKLKKCNGQLGKFSHVNKKALDQYTSFTQQREELLQRKLELDEGGEAIRKLIDHLDQKKDEAINRTFKGIAKHFKTVFKKLVPGGNGQITIKRKEDLGDSKHNRSTENFSGIGIKVSFTGGSGGDRLIKGLSGGQQSIVALSLIFAIQRCDPSPFYLFDEIDANLDAVYRRAVADMIREQCSSAQFITTTFRPELLEHANKFYGVVFQNKMSKIGEIQREDAQDIISQVEQTV